MQQGTEFLPVSRQEMAARGWDELDFVLVTGDAYVDHPSFGSAIIGRRAGGGGLPRGRARPSRTIPRPRASRLWASPRYGFFIGGGNVDSMVAHYSVAKIRRNVDEYTPGGVAGKRPDRSATVYTQLAKQAYPDLPVVLGGLEASLRRFAHYDYWIGHACCPASSRTPGRTCSASAWASTRRRRSPAAWRRGRRPRPSPDVRRHLLHDRFCRPAGPLCRVRRLCQGEHRQGRLCQAPAASRWTTRTR